MFFRKTRRVIKESAGLGLSKAQNYVETTKKETIKVLEELSKEHSEFADIKVDKLGKVFDKVGIYRGGRVILGEMELFNELLKCELLAFCKRNSGIVTYLECFEIVMKILFNESGVVKVKLCKRAIINAPLADANYRN